jgi:hypothetical protein
MFFKENGTKLRWRLSKTCSSFREWLWLYWKEKVVKHNKCVQCVCIILSNSVNRFCNGDRGLWNHAISGCYGNELSSINTLHECALRIKSGLNGSVLDLRLSQRSLRYDFSNITPCSPVLSTRFMLGTCLAYSSTLQMDATSSSETSVPFYWPRWRHIADDTILLNSLPSQCHVQANTDKIFMWYMKYRYHLSRNKT